MGFIAELKRRNVLRMARTPNNFDALAYLGYVERRQGKWQQGVEHLIRASELEPRNPGFMITIGGETLKLMRRYDEARVWLDRALALSPDAAEALAYKAETYVLEGRLDEAERVLDPLPADGQDPYVLLVRSTINLYQRQYDAVIEELQPLLAQPDSSLYGRAPLLALAYAGLGENTKALQQAQRAVALNSNDAIYHPFAEITLAQVRTLRGDHQAAFAGLERSLQDTPGITQADLRLDPIWDPLRGDPDFEALLTKDADESTGAEPQESFH